MAEGKTNVLQDILLPAFAFLASASGPYGAAGAQGLIGALNVGERRRAGEREERRLGEVLRLRGEEQAFERQKAQKQAEFERPKRELEAARAQFELNNLEDVDRQVNAPVAAPEAVQTLGLPQTARLQEALGRGEQAPLPMAAPTPQQKQELLQQMSPAALSAAGLKDVATRVEARLPKPEDPRQFAEDKRQAMGMFNNIPSERIDPFAAKQIKKRVANAKTQQELNDAIAEIPIGLGAPRGSVDEQVYRELTSQGMSGIEALKSVSGAKREPPDPMEQQERQARIAKLQAQANKFRKESTGELSKADRLKLQQSTRSDIKEEPVYKDYHDALGGYTAVSVGARRNDAQGDLAILNGIVRLLDPGSVVRPSEFETARRAQGIIEQLKVLVPRIQQGEILEPAVRQRYLTLANELLQEYANTATQEIGQVYGSLLKDTGISLNSVFVQPRPIPLTEPSGATVTLGSPPGEQPQQPQGAAPAFTIKGIREKAP